MREWACAENNQGCEQAFGLQEYLNAGREHAEPLSPLASRAAAPASTCLPAGARPW
jgi:hypothetical protein